MKKSEPTSEKRISSAQKQKPIKGRLLPHAHGVLGLVWVLTNALLAYSHIPLKTKLWIGLLGLVLPFLFLLKNGSWLSTDKVPFHRIDFFHVSRWVWLLLALAAVFLRFYKLGTLSVWPMWDDGHYSYFAINQAENWHWRMFFGSEQYMPTYTTLQALYYKLFEPSLSSMWLFPVLVSLPLLPLAYWAVRQYASRSFALVYLWLLAFSFWPFYITRFSTDINLCLAWEYGAFLVLGLLQKTAGNKKKKQAFLAALLGFLAGTGWYISKFWVPNIPVFFLLAVYVLNLKQERGRKLFFLFSICFFITFLPLLVLILTGRYGSHIQDYSIFTGSFADSHGNQWAISFSYLTSLLWGPLYKDYFNFGPLWGGFLNPLLGSAFLAGLAAIFRQQGIRSLLLGGFLSAIYLLPGVLSETLEMMRVVPLLPLFLGVVAMGLQSFSSLFSAKKRIISLGVLLLVSLGLDFYHLWGPYHQWAVPGIHSGDSKSAEKYRAYQILDQIQAKEGPGLVLTEFIPSIFDQSLLVACYPFNAARNPKLDPQKATWAVVLTNFSFEPYLSKRFPRSKNYQLAGGSPELAASEGDLILFVFPLDDLSGPVARRWLEAHRRVQNLFDLMPYHLSNPYYGDAIQEMKECRGAFEGDPFLNSSYREKLFDLLAQRDETFNQAIELMQEAIRNCAADPRLEPRRRYLLGQFLEQIVNRSSHGRDNSKAMTVLYQILRSGHQPLGFYQLLVQLEMNRRNYRQALWVLQLARKLYPDNPPPEYLVQRIQDQLATEKGRIPPAHPRKENKPR